MVNLYTNVKQHLKVGLRGQVLIDKYVVHFTSVDFLFHFSIEMGEKSTAYYSLLVWMYAPHNINVNLASDDTSMKWIKSPPASEVDF